jgi:hypothetical protein
LGAWRLLERSIVLAVVIVLILAVVVVYVVRSVKPRRVRLRAGVGKITILDFEADAGNQSEEPQGQPRHCGTLNELPSAGADGERDSLKQGNAWE